MCRGPRTRLFCCGELKALRRDSDAVPEAMVDPHESLGSKDILR